MLDPYAESAKVEISDFVERSTRFVPGNIRFSGEQSFVVKFRVDVRHQVSGLLSEHIYAGRIGHSHFDLIVESSDEYQTVSSSLVKEAEGRLDTVRDLHEMMLGSQYAAYVERFEFHRYHRRTIFTYTCPNCSGSGTVTCSGCGGSGHTSCTSCGGSGSQLVTHHETDHNGDSHSTSHFESCSWCMGAGHDTCASCGGSGTETCGTCLGHGILTQIGTPLLVVDPTYNLAAVEPNDIDIIHALESYATLPHIGDGWAQQQHRAVEADEERRCVIDRVNFTCPFCKVYLSVEGTSGRMVVFGDKCTISDAGNLIENLVRPDLGVLTAAIAKLRWFDMPMTWHVQRIARQFMESEVHQFAVQGAPARANTPVDYRDIANRISRALSQEYLHDAMRNMETVAKWTSASHAYFIGLVTLIFGVPFVMHQIWSDHFFLAVISALGVFLISGLVRWQLTLYRLRWIGGQHLVDFAARRGIKSRFKFTW
jgi:hypothetical protein